MQYKPYSTDGECVGGNRVRCFLCENGNTIIIAPTCMSPVVADTLASHLAMVRAERERQEREANPQAAPHYVFSAEVQVVS